MKPPPIIPTTRTATPGTATVPTSCLGIRVVFDPTWSGISDSRGLFWWKRIFVGRAFLGFPPREQQAILLHEVGHCKLRHLEKRLLGLWRALWWPALFRLCVAQEYEADRFAAGCGYGPDLAQAFRRIRARKSPLHPPLEHRIQRLLS